jgi:8-oxo-dGTP pyrophosphatase MutT (NUDIX family)
MLTRWKTLSSKILYKNPWWTYKVDNYQIPDKISGEYHYVHTEGSSMVIPVREDGMLILVNQYRYLCSRESIEFPCGGVKPRKSYEEMAMMELEEETGYRSDQLERVAEFNPYNGVTNEFCAVFLARKLSKTAPRPDETEEFEVITCTPAEFDEMILEGKIWDGMTLAAWSLVKEKIV